MTWLEPAGGVSETLRGYGVTVKDGDFVNEYGTPVSGLRCDSCGRETTICPKLVADDRFPTDALAR